MKTRIVLVMLLMVTFYGCKEQLHKNHMQDHENTFYDGPIIDMHLHAYNEHNGMFGMTHPPTLRNETYEGVKSAQEQMEQTLAKMREHNIVKAMVTNGELWQEQAPDRVLIANSGIGIEQLRQQYEEGQLQAIAEMSPFYQGILADDPSQIPYFQLAEELGIPVGFHVFPGGPNAGFHLMPQMLGGMRVFNANPLQLEKVLVQFPKLKLYIMHGGWPYVDDVKALLFAHPNLYVDIAVLNWILPQEEFNTYIKALINAGFSDRIMHGTDQMVWPQVISVGIATVNNADFLSLEQKSGIFFDNAARFLELTVEEIKILKASVETIE